jgi:predicted RNA-binding protein associated with RNAse of E/G family
MGETTIDIELRRTVRQYVSIKKDVTELTSRQNELKKRLLESIENLPANEKGHRVLEFDDEQVGSVKLTKQRKVIKSLDIDVAEEILIRKGIKDTCIKMVPVLDEDEIMAAFYNGYLTEEDIDTMFPAKEIFAFIVDAK